MSEALINKIINFSSVDGMGNRTAIFVEGCNFNCLYCHNPETINLCINCGECVQKCPVKALEFTNGKVLWNDETCVSCDSCIKTCTHSSSPKVKWMSAEEVAARVLKNVPYIRGITVSGGECTLYRDFIVELFGIMHTHGLSCLLDSNGTYDFENDAELLEVTDGVMLDVKAFEKDEHIKITGCSNEMVLKNLEFLAKVHKLPEVRTVIVPNLFDVRNTVTKVSKLLSPYGSEILYKVIKYRPFGVRKSNLPLLEVPSDALLRELNKIISTTYGLKTVTI